MRPALPTTQVAPTPELAPPAEPSASSPEVDYVSEEGHFAIRYPEGYRIYVGEKPSVDGVIIPLRNSITLVSSTSPNFGLTIEHFAFENPLSLEDFISQDDCLLDATSARGIVVGTEPGALFADTPCGPVGSSLAFLVHEKGAYRLTIETVGNYAQIEESVMAVLSTFEWTGQGVLK